MFGEIDTGFVIWYRAKKYGLSVSLMLEETLGQYKAFLEELHERGHAVLCISTPLPTIPDGCDFGVVANARSSISGSQVERTELTRSFNRSMREYCHKRNFGYLMLDELSVGSDGLVDGGLKHSDPSDHHYHPDRYAELLVAQLRRFGMAERGVYDVFL